MIIQRRADQLQPGDTLANPRRVIYRTHRRDGGQFATGSVQVLTVLIQAYQSEQPLPPYPPESFSEDQTVNVEVPDLTPAQARADELLDLTRKVSEHASAFLAVEARRLINLIDPKPPTLDEVLRVLDDLANVDDGESRNKALDLLDRARRHGLLK